MQSAVKDTPIGDDVIRCARRTLIEDTEYKDKVEIDNEVKTDVKNQSLDNEGGHSELSNANMQSGLGFRTPHGTETGTESVSTKDIQQGEEWASDDSDSDSFPQDIKDTIATLLLTVDRIDSKPET